MGNFLNFCVAVLLNEVMYFAQHKMKMSGCDTTAMAPILDIVCMSKRSDDS